MTTTRRPSEADARCAIEAWLDRHAPGYPTYQLCEDGDEHAGKNKCGWAFWVADGDTTSYLHEDLKVEWYGTGWPDFRAFDDESGEWISVSPRMSQ